MKKTCSQPLQVFLTCSIEIQIRTVFEDNREAGVRERVKVMSGGAPVTHDFVNKIGSNAYGANAALAVEKAKELVN